MVLEIWSTKDRIFSLFGHFLPYNHYNNPESQSFEKTKKRPRDIIILHRCTINENHMMNEWFLRYGAPQKEFFLTLDNFLPLPPNN